MLLAYASLRLLASYPPPGLPRLDEVGLDAVAVAGAFLGGLAVVAVSGCVPLLVVSKADASAAFRTRDQSSPSRRRVQDVLVTAQIAGAMTLLVSAVLLAQSFVRVQSEDPGFPAERLLIVRIDRPASPRFFLDARDRIGALSGVVAVGGITDFFIRRAGDQRVTIEGQSFADAEGRLPKLVIDSVTPGYFQAMSIPILDGRDFEDRDLAPGAPSVVIVNDAIARRFWPGESAVGKRLVGGSSPPRDGKWRTVVGVVKDMRREGLDVSPILAAFTPSLLRNMDMTIRASTRLESLIPEVRQAIRSLDPSLPVPAITTANGRLAERLGSRRFETQAVGAFATIALVLAVAGLYALVSYQVALRTREIGIRSALGAHHHAIVRLFVWRGVRLALAGAALGIAAAALASEVLQGLLYQTTAVNFVTYAASAGVVVMVAALAAWRPAQAAARVSPMAVLRDS